MEVDSVSEWCMAVIGAAMFIFACETWPIPTLKEQEEQVESGCD
jgi:hypothetical protein